MSSVSTTLSVIDHLSRLRSRASAAALGDEFIRRSAPCTLQIHALDALQDMPCDWMAVIFKEIINNPSRRYSIKRHAVELLGQLIKEAVDRGYDGIDETSHRKMVEHALNELLDHDRQDRCWKTGTAEELCDHLDAAIEKGVFGSLPDF